MRQFVCETCGKTFFSKKYCKSRIPKYCCMECYAESLRQYKTCQYCGKVFADYTKKKYCSTKCRSEASRGVPLSAEHRKKLSEARKASPKCHGANLYNWKGGMETYKQRMALHNASRRKSMKKHLEPVYLKALKFVQGNRCFYCGSGMGTMATIEHLVPVSRGGDNDWWNLVYSCQSCNSKKHNLTLAEYAVKKREAYLIDKADVVTITAKMLYDRKC